MWNSFGNNQGKYIIRVYLGLGKPKLGKGIYDTSYTKDIDFLTTIPDTNLFTQISCECIPNDVVNYKIKGNGVRLDKNVKTLLTEGKLQIVLSRV